MRVTPSAEPRYSPEPYWQKRFARNVDLTTVGDLTLGYAYNCWLYRARFGAMRRALKKLAMDVSGRSVLDIGVGSGAWIPFWQKHGVSKIVGFDIASASVRALRERYPQFRFIRGNICSALPVEARETFHIVTAFDVLFHVTDDQDFSRAIVNISGFLKPGGWALLTDSFCAKPWGPSFHEYHRSYDHYLTQLDTASLTPIHMEPIFHTMTPPLSDPESPCGRARTRLTSMSLRLVRKLSSRPGMAWMNHGIGCSLFLLDNALCRCAKSSPSLKILFARKRS